MWMHRHKVKIVILIIFWVVFNIIWQTLYYDIKTLSDYIAHYDKAKEQYQRDWHDKEAIAEALSRSGLGEQGVAIEFSNHHKKLYEEYGYDALLSDQISVNRSVPDIRPIMCKNMTYEAKLPKVTIIIIFYNERRSVLLRTVHSILNRSPTELINEIILVDDCSSWSDVQAPLTEYLSMYLPSEHSKVRLVRLPERKGLMIARMSGARAASKQSKVLIFLDSHFEVMYNWLPPLLEPIAFNPKACTCPAIDIIQFKTFEYVKSQPYRGMFDWHLDYKMMPYESGELSPPTKLLRNYVMLGCAIAIGADFFWELGGFDEGMDIWGGEQFELSFKIWMCGGELLEVPCSRMGHLFRDPDTRGNTNLYQNYSFVDKNYHRLVAVWMDEEHREYVFKNRPDTRDADPGDLTEILARHDRLQCNSFTWMIENIMPNLKKKFPPNEPGPLAEGLLRPVLAPMLCITLDANGTAVLQNCPARDDTIDSRMYWIYTWRAELHNRDWQCLETHLNANKVTSWGCHQTGGNQRWFYDRKILWIRQNEYNVCIAANIEESSVYLSKCDKNNLKLKWAFSSMNQTLMDEYEDNLSSVEDH